VTKLQVQAPCLLASGAAGDGGLGPVP